MAFDKPKTHQNLSSQNQQSQILEQNCFLSQLWCNQFSAALLDSAIKLFVSSIAVASTRTKAKAFIAIKHHHPKKQNLHRFCVSHLEVFHHIIKNKVKNIFSQVFFRLQKQTPKLSKHSSRKEIRINQSMNKQIRNKSLPSIQEPMQELIALKKKYKRYVQEFKAFSESFEKLSQQI